MELLFPEINVVADWTKRTTDHVYHKCILLKLRLFLFWICSLSSLFFMARILDRGIEQDGGIKVTVEMLMAVFGMMIFTLDVILISIRGIFLCYLGSRESNYDILLQSLMDPIILLTWLAYQILLRRNNFQTDETQELQKDDFNWMLTLQLPRIIDSVILGVKACIAKYFREDMYQRQHTESLLINRRESYGSSLDSFVEEPFLLRNNHRESVELESSNVLSISDYEIPSLPSLPSWDFPDSMSAHNTEEIPLDKLKRSKYEDLMCKLDYKDCSVCLCPFIKDPDHLLIVLPCNAKSSKIHVFHERCILEWLKTRKICPLCRTKITTADLLRYNSNEEHKGQ
ncbi:unnamed protein product [Moneuplotes crassus]|uniref:RING-type domain-containing protein n=1 Tax=Euplotes crassus TaxID=5936 RepID=A0AAD1XEL6_EUPCR|nr:unnamed protein product [Moneuplotes crassus]